MRPFADQVVVDYHFIHVFGDARSKLEVAWQDRGGFAGYAAHVRAVAERFDHVDIHPDTWSRTVPRSSMPCHLFLQAVRLIQLRDGNLPKNLCEQALAVVRKAFFAEESRCLAKRIAVCHCRETWVVCCDA